MCLYFFFLNLDEKEFYTRRLKIIQSLSQGIVLSTTILFSRYRFSWSIYNLNYFSMFKELISWESRKLCVIVKGPVLSLHDTRKTFVQTVPREKLISQRTPVWNPARDSKWWTLSSTCPVSPLPTLDDSTVLLLDLQYK